MKKIAHICTSSYSHSILVDKLKILAQKGYDVHLISANDGYDECLLAKAGIKPHFIYMNREINLKDDLISIIKMAKLFQREKFDIIHTHTAKAGIIGRIASKLTQMPITIHTSHGLPFYEGQRFLTYKFYKFLERIGSLFCDAISSQNKEDMKILKKMLPYKQIYYEGNGIDLQELDEKLLTIKNLSPLKSSLGINQETKIILVAARFEPVKNHYFLIEGLKELQKRFNQFVCILAGDGPLREEIIRMIEANGLQNHIKLVGYQKDIYPLIKMADVITLTSVKEGIPRIIMEAMAFSKPIVASNVLGTRELVQHKKTGILVEYKNVNLLAEGLQKLLENKSLGETYGLNGRRVIEEEFTEEIVVNRLISMYNEMQKKKGLLLEVDQSIQL